MKITVIGGGSTYTPELVNGFLSCAASLSLDELCLMNIDASRLEIVGRFAQIKSCELSTVEAAVHGNRQAAYQSLLSHPLGPEADRVQAVLDDLLETNKKILPQFNK